MKLKIIFKKFRVILFLFCLFASILAINPSFEKGGIAIKAIEANSSASNAGIIFDSKIPQRDREVIKDINNQDIKNLEDYSKIIESVKNGDILKINTNKGSYAFLKTENLGLVVEERATSNIKKGLDLQGGTRVLLKPERPISEEERQRLMDTMEFRLNTYGLSDIVIKGADDILSKDKYIVVEIAGESKEEVKEKVASQGKFEAKIGNETVFIGGQDDVVYVCRNDGTCSGVRSCDEAQDGYVCDFEFQIKLSDKAAKKHAEVTKDIPVNTSSAVGGRSYLEERLELFLDDNLIDDLMISSDLKGKPATDILISGPGYGKSEEEALNDALKNMNKLQTVLITGSLPVKLEIERLDSISPVLGEAFIKNTVYAGLFALLAVGAVIFIRYRKLKITIPIMFIVVSEAVLTLGVASLLKYSMDLPAIAGIIAAVGTGVDDQIVITDEVLRKEGSYFNWKERIKGAFWVILVAYATNLAAMLPLFKAGGGLLTGFAVTTIIGISVGVFITRPAYASIIEGLLKED